MFYNIQKIAGFQQQIYTTRDTLTLQRMVLHVCIGKTSEVTIQKRKIIVELLQVIKIMLMVLGVIHLVVDGKGVTYRYVKVSKMIPIHTYRSGVNQM
jgi:hypothetical protein